MARKEDFFEDMALAVNSWTQSMASAIASKNGSLAWVDNLDAFECLRAALVNSGVPEDFVKQALSECLRGVAVSFLTILDGGTSLSEKGRIYVVDEQGNKLGEGLHDDFALYLIDTGRLK